MSAEKLKIGITTGDINGIGTEIVIKALADNTITDLCTPVYYGSPKVVSFYRKLVNLPDFSFFKVRNAAEAHAKKSNLISLWEEELPIEPGKYNPSLGKYALLSLKTAVEDLLKGNIQALVTAPVNKEQLKAADFPFPGHTEYLEQAAGSKGLMLLVSEEMRVAVATGHIPLQQVAQTINKDMLLKKLQLLNQTLQNDFSIRKPRIAVLGLNPHAGDNGVIGNEESTAILPAIEEAKARSIFAVGPYPADGFFGQHLYKKFDAVLAMYHDQGLVPFKTHCFETGVNVTAGLSIIRTSPDHGVAYDIAGKNLASEQSFRQAIYQAIDIYKHRTENKILKANPLHVSKGGEKDN